MIFPGSTRRFQKFYKVLQTPGVPGVVPEVQSPTRLLPWKQAPRTSGVSGVIQGARSIILQVNMKLLGAHGIIRGAPRTTEA